MPFAPPDSPSQSSNLISAAHTERFRLNLKSLSSRQPEFAHLLGTLPILQDSELMRGRDGHWTWRIRRSRDRGRWLGETSMPSISAPIWVESYESTGGNVWLAGPACGLEMGLLASRMPPHTAVFVLAHEVASIVLQLHLYDYCVLIDAGRLVFFGIETLETDLPAFVSRNPGYELPRQLLFTPPVSTRERAEIQTTVERASERAAIGHAESLESLICRADHPRKWSESMQPTIALVSVDARPHALEHARKVKNALEQLELRHRVCLPDRPESCHAVARLQAIVESEADLVLWLNRGADGLPEQAFRAATVASWFVGEMPEPSTLRTECTGTVVAFVDRGSSANRLSESRSGGDRVYVCEPATDPVQTRRVRVSPDDRIVWGADVAVLADRTDDEPGSAGITLPSHTDLWRALRQTARRRLAENIPPTADTLLAQAEQLSGVSLTDKELRSSWLGLIAQRIIPAAQVEAAVRGVMVECASIGATIALFGRNWHQLADFKLRHRGTIPAAESCNIVLNSTRLLVLPDEGLMSIYYVLDALAVGTPVAVRGVREQFLKEYPRLADVAQYILFFASPHELQRCVRECLAEANPPAIVAQASQTIQRNHTMVQRVRCIIDTVRGLSFRNGGVHQKIS